MTDIDINRWGRGTLTLCNLSVYVHEYKYGQIAIYGIMIKKEGYS